MRPGEPPKFVHAGEPRGPLEDSPLRFEALADLALVRRFAIACHRLSGRSIYIVDVDPAKYRAFHDRKRMAPFCALVQGTARGRALCKASDLKIRGTCASTRKACAGTCWAGLTDMVAPIEVGGRLLGFLAAGQVHARPPKESGFERVRRKAGAFLPVARLRRAWWATPTFPAAKVRELLSLFQVFIEYLGELETKLALRGRDSEPEAVARAKAYLAGHWKGPVRLGEVAAYANVSAEHLCRLLKRETGRTMTELLNAIRLEEAKKRLEGSDARVSQVARETGFATLAHFDRIFRRRVGMSPRSWRDSRAAGQNR
ncbi:MAG: PocR ligand-binding domain-containing protein [Spirochaetes bacterium]|nr:PocR ligand-binding domain-containing protein [Spirochaetota bacterium]